DAEGGRARLGLDPHGRLGDPAPGGSICDLLVGAAPPAAQGKEGSVRDGKEIFVVSISTTCKAGCQTGRQSLGTDITCSSFPATSIPSLLDECQCNPPF